MICCCCEAGREFPRVLQCVWVCESDAACVCAYMCVCCFKTQRVFRGRIHFEIREHQLDFSFASSSKSSQIKAWATEVRHVVCSVFYLPLPLFLQFTVRRGGRGEEVALCSLLLRCAGVGYAACLHVWVLFSFHLCLSDSRLCFAFLSHVAM